VRAYQQVSRRAVVLVDFRLEPVGFGENGSFKMAARDRL
jgi:hypothetical protein